MTHNEFIEKMAKYKPWYEYQPSSEGKDTTNQAAAKKFGVLGCAMAAGVKFYANHKEEPQLPEYGDMTHKSVVAASRFLNLTDMDALRRDLVKHYGEFTENKMRPPQKYFSRLIGKILKNSGLEWFKKKNRPVVHWKHCV